MATPYGLLTLTFNGTGTAVVEGQDSISVLMPFMRGPRGYGVPPGGITGQVLVKLSDDDYDTGWVDPADALGGG